MNGKPEAREKVFEDFEIWIHPPLPGNPTSYPTEVVISTSSGPASGALELDLNDAEFQAARVKAEAEMPLVEDQQAFGALLYERLFSGDVLTRWIGSSKARKEGLRIRLRIAVPELARLPWELLYHKEMQFLASTANQALSRYLLVPEPPPLWSQAADERLRILLVIEDPRVAPWADIASEEKEGLQQAIEGLGNERVRLDVLENASMTAIQNALQQADYQALHYLGHARDGALILVDEKEARPIYDHQFASYFRGRSRLRLVVLSACQSGQAEKGGLFAGVGPALVQNGVPAVVAMQYNAVYLETAGKFSAAFYQSLANGLPVDVAVNEARQHLYSLHPDARDWSTPVLYMGTRSGRILDVPQAGVEALKATAQQSPQAVAGLAELTQQLADVGVRSNRLAEWSKMESYLRAMQRGVEALMNSVDTILRRPSLDPFDIQVSLLGTWDQSFEPSFSELRAFGERLKHISHPLPSGNGSPPVADWFRECHNRNAELIKAIASLRDAIQDYANWSEQEQGLRNTLKGLQANSRSLRDFVRDRNSDRYNQLEWEAAELAKETSHLHDKLQ